MATVRKRGSRYNVQIRKEGYPFITKTFRTISVAKKWANSIESNMERHLYIEVPDQTTVGELLKRYQRQILPFHKTIHVLVVFRLLNFGSLPQGWTQSFSWKCVRVSRKFRSREYTIVTVASGIVQFQPTKNLL